MSTVAPLAHIDGAACWSLSRELGRITPREPALVRLTPYWSDAVGEPHIWHTVLVLDSAGREVPLPRGAHNLIRDALWQAFPAQWLDQTVDYDIATGDLRLHRPPVIQGQVA